MDLLALAELVQQRLRYKGNEWGINVTQMRVLEVMGALPTDRRGAPCEGHTPTEVARDLGMETRAVAAQMRALLDRGMLALQKTAPAGDGRERRYRMLASGRRMGVLVKACLGDIDILLRSILGHKEAALCRGLISKMAAELPSAPALLRPGSAISFHVQKRNQRRRATTDSRKATSCGNTTDER